MKKLLPLILIAFTSLCFCQNAFVNDTDCSVELSNTFPCKDASRNFTFETDSGFISIKTQEHSFVIQSIDADGLLESKQSIHSNDRFGAIFYLEDAFQIADKIYILYHTSKTPNAAVNLYCRAINSETGSFEGEQKLLLSVREKLEGKTSKFTFRKSFDDSKLLIYYSLKSNIQTAQIGLHAFDQKFNKLWSKTTRMPFPKNKLTIWNSLIDSKAKVYFNCSFYDNKQSDEQSKAKKYGFFIYSSKSDKAEIKEIKIDEVFDIGFREIKNNKIVGAGYYKLEGIVSGIFKFKINPYSNLIETKEFPFSNNLMDQLVKDDSNGSETVSKSELSGLTNLKLKKFDLSENGQIVLIGEQDYIESSSSGSAFTFHHSDNILFAIISSSDKIQTLYLLPKKQFTKTCIDCIGFKHFKKKNDHFLLFTDDLKNRNLNESDKPSLCKVEKDGAFYMYKINGGSGSVSKKMVLNKLDVSGHILKTIDINRIYSFQGKYAIIDAFKNKNENLLLKFLLE